MRGKRFTLFPVLLLILALCACNSSSQSSPSAHASVQTPVRKAATCSSTISIAAIGSGSTAPSSSSLQHMKMGPHMRMTAIWPRTAEDMQRARAILQNAQVCFARYRDYRVALHDGYQIFAPNVPQDIYHFASVANFEEAQTTFHLAHPSALLYNKVGSDYQLVGIMYSAPANFTEEQLNERFPLSIAPWHLHINICLPAGDHDQALFAGKSQFGLDGTITTPAACRKVGGMFFPQLFGWMVHIYPFEQ